MHEEQSTGAALPRTTAVDVARLIEDELSVVYQPIVGLRARRLVGVEALARLDGPAGPIRPSEFIPIAACSGLLDVVLDRVLRSVAARLASLEDGAYAAVNFSSSQMRDPAFVDRLRKELSELGIRPEQLVLEISEADLPEFDHETETQLESLRRLGIRIAADDVGTGYANLSTLVSLRPEILKIDRSIILGLPDSPWDAVVTALVEVADSIGAQVVAEGIETTGQLAAVGSLGVHAGQGYLLGRPSQDPLAVVDLTGADRVGGVGRAPRVALIDDDPRFLALAAAVLGDDGFDLVLQDTDSAMFLSRLRHTPVDIAIVDLVLAHEEDAWLSIVRPLRLLRPEIEIIVSSTMFDPTIRREAEELGCHWFENGDGPAALSRLCAAIVDGSSRPLVLRAGSGAALTR